MKLSSFSIFFSCLISINQFILLHNIFPKVRTCIRNWKTQAQAQTQAHQFLIFWYISLKSLQFLISEFLLTSGSLLYCLLDHYCSAGTGIDSKTTFAISIPPKAPSPIPLRVTYILKYVFLAKLCQVLCQICPFSGFKF